MLSEKIEERIRELERRLADTTPNKHTQKSINYLRASIAKLRDQLVRVASNKSGGGAGFGVKKTGDAQVAFIGFPSVGKSTLLNLLTGGHTSSKVAAYDFTTLAAVPGMMEVERARVQLIDLPGIVLGAATGRGRGKEVLGAVRTAELILVLVCFRGDGTINFDDLATIRKELADAGIRLNQRPARIVVKPAARGGIGLTARGHQLMDRDEVKALLNEFGYHNAGVYFNQPDVTPAQLIDHLLGNRVYTREFVVINKSDLAKAPVDPAEVTRAVGHDHWQLISAANGDNVDALRHAIFRELGLIRVYLKPPGRDADLEDPVIMRRGDTLAELCRKLHKTFLSSYRYALVWGDKVKHPGQKFHTTGYELADGDVVSIYLRR
ncbi:MAG: OBG GTPase family GTP-binding protein [Promethearchaeota archaeon]